MTSTVLPRSTSRCKHVEQHAHVLEVQAGRRLVEDVERATRVALRELGRELHALRFAAGQRRRALPEMDVAESDVGERLKLLVRCAAGSERTPRASSTVSSSTSEIDQTAKAHLERLAIVALALAHLARHVDVGQEVHLDLHETVALTRLAPSALHVEREAPRSVAANLRLGQLGEQLANRREQARCTSPDSSAACGRSDSGRCR